MQGQCLDGSAEDWQSPFCNRLTSRRGLSKIYQPQHPWDSSPSSSNMLSFLDLFISSSNHKVIGRASLMIERQMLYLRKVAP